MFTLKLISPHNVPDHEIEIFNAIYEEWKITFREVVESKGGKLDPDDFFRNDHVVAILNGNEVVASCTLTFFDTRLKSSLDHHYFKALQEWTPRKISKRNIHRMISIEYLNVLPAWRKTHSHVPWVEVIIGSVLKIMDTSIADAVIGTPRIDAKVINSCLNLEAIEVQEPIQKMDYPCAVVIFPKQNNRRFKNSLTQEYVDMLLASLETPEFFAPNQFNKAA